MDLIDFFFIIVFFVIVYFIIRQWYKLFNPAKTKIPPEGIIDPVTKCFYPSKAVYSLEALNGRLTAIANTAAGIRSYYMGSYERPIKRALLDHLIAALLGFAEYSRIYGASMHEYVKHRTSTTLIDDFNAMLAHYEPEIQVRLQEKINKAKRFLPEVEAWIVKGFY